MKSVLQGDRFRGECGVTSTMDTQLGITHKRCTDPAVALINDRVPLCAKHHVRFFSTQVDLYSTKDTE